MMARAREAGAVCDEPLAVARGPAACEASPFEKFGTPRLPPPPVPSHMMPRARAAGAVGDEPPALASGPAACEASSFKNDPQLACHRSVVSGPPSYTPRAEMPQCLNLTLQLHSFVHLRGISAVPRPVSTRASTVAPVAAAVCTSARSLATKFKVVWIGTVPPQN